MTKLLEILGNFLKEMEKENPYHLVLKGGTALSLYELNHHRESEDLDFDADKELIKQYKHIEKYLSRILDTLQKKGEIKAYSIIKADFAATDRYHIKLEIQTYKTFYSKIDIDFVELPIKLVSKGQLYLYPKERALVSKLITFTNRKEFKDLYDIAHLIVKVDAKIFKRKENMIVLIEEVIKTIQQEDMRKRYRLAFRNVDLRFKNLKESALEEFIQNTTKKLHLFVNKIKK